MSATWDEELIQDTTGETVRGQYAGLGEQQKQSGYGSSYTGPKKSTPISTKKPAKLSNKFAEPFYYNGPRADPWDHHVTQMNQIKASIDQYSEERQTQSLDYFQTLLTKYGHTNSPGTLWALAQSGLDDNSDAIRQMLNVDAEQANSTNTTAIAVDALNEEDEGSDLWAPLEWASRNAFSALTMPMQALQGGARGMLSAWFDETNADMSFGEKLGQTALYGVSTVAPPLAAVLDGLVVDDEEFQNPWEQTDMGQALLTAADNPENVLNPFNPAYNEMTAGLDLDAAQKLLMENDNFAAERETLMMAPEDQREKVSKELLTNIALENDLYGGPGWFIDETSIIGEKQKETTINTWAMEMANGDIVGWTPGRGIAAATIGVDSAGYNFTSGLIDAVATIAGDPTIWGSKFGVVSKTAQGLSGGKVLIGKAAKEARAAQGTTNIQVQNLLEEWNSLATQEDGLLYGRQMNLEDWSDLDAVQQAAMVKEMKSAQAANLAVERATPAIQVVERRARDARRAEASVSRAGRAQGSASENFNNVQRTVELLQEMQEASRLKRMANGSVYSERRFQNWAASLSESDAILWNASQDKMTELIKSGTIKMRGDAPSWDDSFSQLVEHYTKRLSTASKKQPTAKFANQADKDAALMILDETANDALQKLDGIDTAGATIAGVWENGVYPAQRAVVDGADSIIYWTGKADPVALDSSSTLNSILKEGEDVASFGKNLLTYIETLFKENPALRAQKVKVSKEELKNLPGTIAARIRDAEDPLPFLRELLENGETTVQQVFLNMSRIGLDGYLDDFIRNEGFDAIKGVNRKTRDGMWFGDHPSVEAYKWPANAIDNAELAGGAGVRTVTPNGSMVPQLDNAAEEFLKNISPTAQRIGMNSMSVDDLETFSREASKKAKEVNATRRAEAANAVEESRAAQIELDNELLKLEEKFSDPVKTLRQVLQYEAGVGYSSSRGVTVDPNGMRSFLFGSGPMSRFRARTMEVLSSVISDSDKAKFAGLVRGSKEWNEVYAKVAPRYLGQINQVVRNKWDPDTVKAVFLNSLEDGGQDGLLKTLAPRLGVDVEKGSLPARITAKDTDGMRYLQTFRTSENRVARAVKRMESLRPGSRMVQIDKAEDVIDSVIRYGVYAKVPAKEIQEFVGQVILNDGTFGASAKNVDVLKSLFNKIGDQLLDNLDESILYKGQGQRALARKEELRRAIKDSTRLFLGGKSGEQVDNTTRVANNADVSHYVDDLGNKVEMPPIQLESELLNGYLNLPNVDEWGQVISRVGRVISRFDPVEKVYEFARGVYDNFFRTGMLVFRIAYILRNSAEMQIRMFLNGHHSVFSDPFTLAGMTIGNFANKGKQGSYLKKAFAPYENTVLDTAFEVGNDEAAALANHVEDYFAVTRQANSLTDPRVYQSSLMRGWEHVTFDSPHFAAGWSNELITLHRSALSRVVMGGFPGAKSTTGIEHQDAAVRWLLGDDRIALETRQRLMAYDDKYKQIFDSPSMTKDFLFDNPNSVYNRVKQFTVNDPVLEDFIRTGRWMGNDMEFSLNGIPQLKDRIQRLQGALRVRFYNDPKQKEIVSSWMQQGNVRVPWAKLEMGKKGTGAFDAFFKFANKIERLGTVGPEFRLAYWDRIAELAKGLNSSEVDRALKAAGTTLSGMKRMMPDNKLVDIGTNHPAWEALKKAKDEGTDGLLTLDEIHSLAMDYAAKEVQGLFYDAARRNNFWASTRLIFPFGQAWGNTLDQWAKLGARNPVQIYKAQKVFNAAEEEGSSSIYESPLTTWLYNDYAPGAAPWDADPNGGFFYQNNFGDSTFAMPLGGKLSNLGTNILNKMNGINVGAPVTEMEAGVKSLNLAIGQENIYPGSSAIANMAVDAGLPDGKLKQNIRNIIEPYGSRDVSQTAIPAWGSKMIAGVGAFPIIGEPLAEFLSPFAPANKNRNVVDAQAILISSGQYNLTDAYDVEKLKNDTTSLAATFTLLGGVFQSVSPATPTFQYGVNLDSDNFASNKELKGMTYPLAFMSKVYQLYLAESANDSMEAKSQMLADFGPAFLFAVTGEREGFSQYPSSQAMQWYYENDSNKKLAAAFPDEFSLFFPKGDPTDVTSRLFLDKMSGNNRPYKSAEQVTDENVMTALRVQRQRVDFMEANDLISSDQADAKRKEIEKSYEGTKAGIEFNSMTATDRVEKIVKAFEASSSLQKTDAGKAFGLALRYRDNALAQARKTSNDPNKTLSGSSSMAIRSAYQDDLDALLAEYPDFKLLHRTLFEEYEG
jgi:hypothetical protein